jgi:hypothetical protein
MAKLETIISKDYGTQSVPNSQHVYYPENIWLSSKAFVTTVSACLTQAGHPKLFIAGLLEARYNITFTTTAWH